MYIGVVQELSLVSYSHPYPICMLTAWILSEVRGRKAWHWLVILVGVFFFKTITKIETEHKRLELRFNLFDFNGKYPQCPSAAHKHTQEHFAIT